MEAIRKHKIIVTAIVAVAMIALILTSFLPYLTLL